MAQGGSLLVPVYLVFVVLATCFYWLIYPVHPASSFILIALAGAAVVDQTLSAERQTTTSGLGLVGVIFGLPWVVLGCPLLSLCLCVDVCTQGGGGCSIVGDSGTSVLLPTMGWVLQHSAPTAHCPQSIHFPDCGGRLHI